MPADTLSSRPHGRRPALVLWDIDHTLLRMGGGVSRGIYERAFRQMTGRPLGELAHMSGRTEQAILTETLHLNGIDAREAPFADFYAALSAAAEALADRMRRTGVVLPGAREAIVACVARNAVQSAVTGNLRPVATTKLTAVGLGEGLDLTVGGYGDDGGDRADLVRQARERASRKYGRDFAGQRTVVVGDTPHDVRGARDADALAVGVASGTSSAGQLREAGADIVLTSLTEFTARCGHALGG